MRSFRIAIAAFLLVGAMAVSAVTTTNVVVFNLADFTSQPATNRKVVIKPLSAPVGDTNTIFSLDWRTFTSDSSGMFSVSNMTPGLYSIELQSPPTLTKFTIGVSSTNETVYASTLLTTATNQTWPPSGTAYTVAASDARYSPIGAGGLAFVPQVGSQSLTNWSMLDTNALTLTSNDVVTALGYAPGTGSGSGITNGQSGVWFPSLSASNSLTIRVGPTNPTPVLNWGRHLSLLPPLYVAGGLSWDTNDNGTFSFTGGHLAGDGAGLTNLNASALASGTVPLARLSGISSNQFDAATSNQLALAGTATTGAWRTNSLPFFTVSAAGIANGLAAVSNAGCMFGPDTPGTVTSGLQEALDAIPRATNQGPLAWGGRIILAAGQFYFTNTLLFSNVWNNGLTLEGAGLFHTKLVYAGAGQGVKTVNLCGTPASLAGGNYPLAGHYNIRDIGFTALNNTTNILLWITNHAYVNIENCLFTSWGLMDNTNYGSGISITHAQTNDSALVGLHLGVVGDCASFVRNCFFNGLATGADFACDHIIVDGFRTAEIGMNTMRWPTNSYYSMGAAILRRGGMDGQYNNVYWYGVRAGLALLNSPANTAPGKEYMGNHYEETCDYPFVRQEGVTTAVYLNTYRNPRDTAHEQYSTSATNGYALTQITVPSAQFIIYGVYNNTYKGTLFSRPTAATNVVFFHGLTDVQDFDEAAIDTSGLTNVAFIWSGTSQSFVGPNGTALVNATVEGFTRWWLTNATYYGLFSIVNATTSGVPIIPPFSSSTNEWLDPSGVSATVTEAYYGTNWGEVDGKLFLDYSAGTLMTTTEPTVNTNWVNYTPSAAVTVSTGAHLALSSLATGGGGWFAGADQLNGIRLAGSAYGGASWSVPLSQMMAGTNVQLEAQFCTSNDFPFSVWSKITTINVSSGVAIQAGPINSTNTTTAGTNFWWFRTNFTIPSTNCIGMLTVGNFSANANPAYLTMVRVKITP